MMKRLSRRVSSALFGEEGDSVYEAGPVEMHAKVSVSVLPDKTLKIPIPGARMTVEDLVIEICKQSGIGKRQAKYFALFQETSTTNIKLPSIRSVTPDTKGLVLRKWCFDLEDEKLLMTIEGALMLLYHQAKHDVSNGRILPDDQVKAKLDELSIPKPETYQQYVSICQGIQDYFAVEFKGCSLSQDFQIKAFKLNPDLKFLVVLFDRGIRLCVKNKHYLISWRKISSWSRVENDKCIEFEVYSPAEDNYSTLAVETPDAHYMLAVLMQMIKNLQDVLDGPMFETSDLIMDSNSNVVRWKNVLFATRRFNAENELAVKYEDLTG